MHRAAPLHRQRRGALSNASNGETGVGAVFGYSEALGHLDRLEPDALTTAVISRFRAASPVRTDFHIGAGISGFVERGTPP